jgi:hypothetical protein
MQLVLHRRKPAAVSRVWFSKIRVGHDGKVDPHHRPETMRLARQEALFVKDAESSVVVAGHRFAERRLSHLGEWLPEQRDLDALRTVINGRAGKEML